MALKRNCCLQKEHNKIVKIATARHNIIWMNLLNDSYLKVGYLINVKMYIITVAEHIFLLCSHIVMTRKTCSFIMNNAILYSINTIQSCDGERSLVSDQLETDRQPVGNLLVTVYWAYVYDGRIVYYCLETTQQPMGDQSATKNCAEIVCNHCDRSSTSRQPAAYQSPTSLRPPKTFLQSVLVSLAVSKTSL